MKPGIVGHQVATAGQQQIMFSVRARPIQKVYEVDPRLCPKFQGTMKIISFIGEPAIIKQILGHLGLRGVCLRATHRQVRNNGPPPASLNIVREPVYLPVRDHAPAGDEVWSQVPNYGYRAD